ncbi:kinesin-domain-containing protein [Aulographum hederae CBS 113979]|uniref:Kinesin-domain-containing protein n=1 Tax=Aulographum hederae CBS 113979 TaxID=1176131 RepID=A0A6G1H6E3_9PEZI|nr:kinesin-domain-containing protein [Aulographum hederae CBS 113979]
MSVRVVARVRPLLKHELDKDTIVTASNPGHDDDASPTIVRIPNPKNDAELYSFQFNSVYDQAATQQTIFDNEVSPTVKHLFNGFDVTLFAYGVTGTGKTHTMRGGKTLAERGVIPRLLSSIYRRCRKIEKDTAGGTDVEVSMSYYEIYNDRVYDLFEPPEKRTPSGLPIRDNNGKTVVVGLTERPCYTLKEFEKLYDEANVNRSTSATKLNAHSSRSHAILCVKVTQTSQDHTLVSTASAIDLAGSEDNRRTDNNRDRLVESASINKSLFVLAQCVEAISRKQSRIPYRESKMTRILSLGQNNGLTIMILNLAPVRSYHLDTLSSLNFANRTKKIEVNEVENEPQFRGPPVSKSTAPISGPSLHRQPLRPLTAGSYNATATTNHPQPEAKKEKPIKAFSVYTDKRRSGTRPSTTIARPTTTTITTKRPLDSSSTTMSSRPTKSIRSSEISRPSRPAATAPAPAPPISQQEIEELISRRIDEKFAERALSENPTAAAALNPELQRRLDSLEQRVQEREGENAEGLQYLMMARQHQARGEDVSALKMFELARPFFPGNRKLEGRIGALRERVSVRKEAEGLEGRGMDSSVRLEPVKGAGDAASRGEGKAKGDMAPPPLPLTTAARKPHPVHRKLVEPSSDELSRPSISLPPTAARAAKKPKGKISRSEELKDGNYAEPDRASHKHREDDGEGDAYHEVEGDEDEDEDEYHSDASFRFRIKPKTKPKSKSATTTKQSKKTKGRQMTVFQDEDASHVGTGIGFGAAGGIGAADIVAERRYGDDVAGTETEKETQQTPRTKHILDTINSRDLAQIRRLKGVGAKKAEAILRGLVEGAVGEGEGEESREESRDESRDELELVGDVEDRMGGDGNEVRGEGGKGGGNMKVVKREVRSLKELGALKGVGMKMVENMRVGVVV